MTTKRLARSGGQIALALPTHPVSIVVVDVKIRVAVVTALARLLLEVAAADGRRKEGHDES